MKAAASTFTLGSVISLTGSNPMVRNIQGGLSIQPLQETPNNPHSPEAVSIRRQFWHFEQSSVASSEQASSQTVLLRRHRKRKGSGRDAQRLTNIFPGLENLST